MNEQPPQATCACGEGATQNEVGMRLNANMDDISHKILVMSGKGGVGKSTVAAYLSLCLAARGYKVGLLDVDLHGPSIPHLLGIKHCARVQEDKNLIEPVVLDHGLKALSVEMLMPQRDASLIWRGPVKIGVIRQFLADVLWGPLDFLVIDSPPGTGDEPLTIAQNVPGAWAVVVTTPQEVALADVRKSLDFCRQVEMPILGVVENMSGLTCPHCHQPIELLGRGGGRALAQRFGLNLLCQVPWDARLLAASEQGRPLDLSEDKEEAGPAYRELVEAVLSRTVGAA